MLAHSFTTAIFAGFLQSDFETEDGQPFFFYRTGDTILAPEQDHTGTHVAGFSVCPALAQKNLITVSPERLIVAQWHTSVSRTSHDIFLSVGDPMPAACDFGNAVYAYGRSYAELRETVSRVIREADIRLPVDPIRLARIARLGGDPVLLRQALEARLAAHTTDHLPLPVFRQHEIRTSLLEPLTRYLGLPGARPKATSIAAALVIDVTGTSCRIVATSKLFKKLAAFRPDTDPLFQSTLDAFSLNFAGLVDGGTFSPGRQSVHRRLTIQY